MYLDFFGLREQPFGVTPDPAFLYLSQTHRDALEAFRSGLATDRGFMALVGEPGLGKTTLLYKLMDEWRESSRVVFLFQTQCDSRDLFRYLLAELGVDAESMGLVAMHQRLNHILFQEMLAGRRFILILDEAQNLHDMVLETVRLLSNFETPHAKLLNIVLAGQPQLADRLAAPEHRQLRQRIAVLSHVRPLTSAEVAEYITYRLNRAGYCGAPLFTSGALQAIAAESHGTPRNINNICHHALCMAAMGDSRTVNAEMVQNVAARLEGRQVELPSLAAELAAENEIATPALSEELAIQDEIPTLALSAELAGREESPVLALAAEPAVQEEIATLAPIPSATPVLAPDPAPAPTPALVPAPILFPAPDLLPAPARASAATRTVRPAAVAPMQLLSYGAPAKSDSRFWRNAAIASCIALLAASPYAFPSVRKFAKQEYKNLTWRQSDDSSELHAAPRPESASESTLPPYDPAPQESESGQIITVAARTGQTVEELSRLYAGHFDAGLYQQICALNPGLSNPDYLEAGQLIRLPLPAGTLKKVVDTADPSKDSPTGRLELAIAKVKELFSTTKR